MNILQFNKHHKNYVGIIENEIVHYIKEPISMHELAKNSIQQDIKLLNYIKNNFSFSDIPYKELLSNYSLTLPMVPDNLTNCFVSGFGLTHINSALLKYDTNQGGRFGDAQNVYSNGLNKGMPENSEIGARPCWFPKGNGHNLVKTGEPLTIFSDSVHVGEEPELVFIYMIGKNKVPYRIGYCLGNDLTDHGLEDENAYYVAQAKFLSGAINSEICIDQLPERFVGKVEIFSQNREKKWDSEFCTGRSKMVHSLENLESYYFRNNMNLNENDVHFLFLGVDRMSFSDGFTIQPEYEVVISSNTFKTKLTNIIKTIEPKPSVSVKTLY